MPHLKVLLTFCEGPDSSLDEFAGEIIEGMTDNPAFPTPPVTMAALQTARTEFSDALVAQPSGGKEATAVKNAKREALITLLRKLAAYVQETSNDVLDTLLSSGFQPASTTHTQSPLEKPTKVSLTNGPDTGQLVVKVGPVPNARSYEVRYAVMTAPGAPIPWQHGGTFTDSRYMLIEGLTAGTMYQVQVRAVGGSTGYSGWSDSQQHMSM